MGQLTADMSLKANSKKESVTLTIDAGIYNNQVGVRTTYLNKEYIAYKRIDYRNNKEQIASLRKQLMDKIMADTQTLVQKAEAKSNPVAAVSPAEPKRKLRSLETCNQDIQSAASNLTAALYDLNELVNEEAGQLRVRRAIKQVMSDWQMLYRLYSWAQDTFDQEGPTKIVQRLNKQVAYCKALVESELTLAAEYGYKVEA